MFSVARLRLTAWYLAIIMVISIMFSLTVYRLLTLEIERFDRMQRFKIQRNFTGQPLFFQATLPPSEELLAEVRQRIQMSLIFVNVIILFGSGALGYFLAGRTLAPIALMLDEQNRFVSDASHELRTPLAALSTGFEVYLRGTKKTLSDANFLITESLEDVRSLQSLTSSLLSLSMYRSASQGIPKNKIDTSSVIRACIKRMGPLANKKDITITTTLTDTRILLQQELFEELVMILIDNAIKYSEQGTSVTLTTQILDKTFLLAIQDQGIGISQKDLPHIFDRFFRSNSARSREKHGGYGLGLSIAKEIVELHKGTIRATSTEHQGTTVSVTIPCS